MMPMRWYLNDLSLQGQFQSSDAFVDAIGELERLRRSVPNLNTQFYCSRKIGDRPVAAKLTCREAVMSTRRREAKNIVLIWINKRGPFLEDDRQFEADDYFQFEGYDVTDQGLGEAARRLKVNERSGVFSFLGGEVDFARSPLEVQHGLDEEPFGFLMVENVWTHDALRDNATKSRAEPGTWAELLKTCEIQFDRLFISGSVLESLKTETFYPVVARRTLEILGVLQEVSKGRLEDGSLDKKALALWQKHSRGEKAWFSDESDTNKRRFRKEMIFSDPSCASRPLFCSWHGKIKSPQFRIHFEWPVPVGQRQLKVLYIGPKITKD